MHGFRRSAAVLAVLGSVLVTDAAVAANATSEVKSTQGFRKAVTMEGIFQHLTAFQSHSDFGGGNRVASSPGFEASATYVADAARAAGFEVSDHFFQFLFNADRTPPTFSSSGTTYVDGVDYASMTFSENVPTTTAPVWAVDLGLGFNKPAGDGTTSTSGCQAADWAGFPAGSIALTRRGGCNFAVKSAFAKQYGAVATLIMNEGNNDTPARQGGYSGTLGSPGQGVALGISYPAGIDLAGTTSNGATGKTATVKVDRINETRTTRNIIAETPTGDPDNVIVVGAHLDSVSRGAGINDNGTGSATILEIAEQLGRRDFPSRNKVRFMWYSAEEFGLLGSQAYVAGLPQSERDRITAMLNFDMVGSPNYVRFVYDGDNSGFPVGPGAAKGPQGSGEIERIFRDYFVGVGLTSGETPFSGRSDYGPFIAAGVDIPAGGLFTGAEGAKTPGQAAVYGGTANVAYDKCYHLACDTLANVNRQGLDEMSDAAAHATYTLARRDFAAAPLVNPTAPVSGSDGLTPSGGGLHDDHDHDDAVE
jgi:Zn-dependent M28 family amino/carboxypeptidase